MVRLSFRLPIIVQPICLTMAVYKIIAVAENCVGYILLLREKNFTERANDKDVWCTCAEKKRNGFLPFQIRSTVE